MKVPTLDHVRKALKIARRGGWKKYRGLDVKVGYRQSSWCGTSCCVWGHALLLAGNMEVAGSEQAAYNLAYAALKVFGNRSKRNKALSIMMNCSSPEVLRTLELLVGDRDIEEILGIAQYYAGGDDGGLIGDHAIDALRAIHT